MEIKMIELCKIKTSQYNARRTFDETKLKELTASIKEKGILEPILVRPSDGKYEIVFGARRVRAAALAGLVSIPAIVKDLNDKQALECQVIENLQREDVHPLEEAEGYEQLMKKHGYKDVKDIAAKVGKSPTYIYGRLKLCELIPENRKFFYEGKFSPSVALLVARVPAHLQKEAGNKVARGEYGRDNPMHLKETQEYIHEHFMLQLKEAQFDPKEKGLAGKGPCAECLKRTGNQKELFPDISGADTCTDPACFEAKKNGFTQRAIAKLKEQGKAVVSQDEAKKLFRYKNDESPENKYMGLDEEHYIGGATRKFRNLIKATKDAKIVYAVQPFSGKIIEMVEKTEIPRILKNAGIKISAEDRSPVKNLAKAKTENRIRFAKRGFWIDKVSTAKDRRCMNVVILDILLWDLGPREANEILGSKSDRWSRSWTIPKLYELGDEKVQQLIVKVISKKSDDLQDKDLEFLSTKLGFSMAKDYTITETYLQAMTKDQLITLAGKIGLTKYLEQHKVCDRLGDKKKTELIDFFLKKGFDLKNKIPKELVE